MESFNFNKLFNRFLDWKITFILHCVNDLLTNLYKLFLKFNENFPKNGRTANNPILGTVRTVCLGTYNLSKNRVVVTFENTSEVFYLYMKIFDTGTNFEKPEQ